MRSFRLLILVIAGLVSNSACAKKAAKQPNIVVIFADDMGYGDLSCYGNTSYKTPHLDRMSSEGVRMTQFYVPSAACSPSRAALLTGKLPMRAGVPRVLNPKSSTGLPGGQSTIASDLKKRGYTTAIVGKWHLGHRPEFLPTRHGFDSYFGLPYSNDMKPAPLMRDEKIIEQVVDQSTLTRRYTEESLAFIDRATSAGAPFFLYFAYTFPHVPLHVSEKFRGASGAGLYGDVMQEIDWSVGEILNRLRRDGLEKNTLVVFLSDNGPWLIRGTHGGSAGGLRDGKGTPYEGGVRIPCIFWCPGQISAGKVDNTPAITMDLLPTLRGLAGIKAPAGERLDGQDIWPLLTGVTRKNAERTFYLADYYGHDEVGAVREGDWKLLTEWKNVAGSTKNKTATRHTTSPELYNLASDPRESNNILENHPDVARSLTSKGDAMREELLSVDPWKGRGDPKTTESLNYVTPGTEEYLGTRKQVK